MAHPMVLCRIFSNDSIWNRLFRASQWPFKRCIQLGLRGGRVNKLFRLAVLSLRALFPFFFHYLLVYHLQFDQIVEWSVLYVLNAHVILRRDRWRGGTSGYLGAGEGPTLLLKVILKLFTICQLIHSPVLSYCLAGIWAPSLIMQGRCRLCLCLFFAFLPYFHRSEVNITVCARARTRWPLGVLVDHS